VLVKHESNHGSANSNRKVVAHEHVAHQGVDRPSDCISAGRWEGEHCSASAAVPGESESC